MTFRGVSKNGNTGLSDKRLVVNGFIGKQDRPGFDLA
jgi:hypothetical protein